MKNKQLTLKVLALIILNDLWDTVAQLIMKKGLVLTGIDAVTPANLLEFVSRNLASPLVWTGVILYTLNFVVWIIVLYKVDLSIALPVGSACYIFVPLAAVFFLHETITPVRWLGILCIVLGVFFVSQSRKRAEEKQW